MEDRVVTICKAIGAIVLATVLSTPHPAAQSVADRDPQVARLIASVSEPRLRAIVERLVSFRTRHSLSNTQSATEGIGAARQWILEELRRSSSKLQVSFDTHHVAPQGRAAAPFDLLNVMAVLPGRTDRRIYVTGHYDTINLAPEGQLKFNLEPGSPQAQDANATAPGADDDGSGVAITMELARVFAESGITFDATLVFMSWAGEELGHFGSMAHVQKLASDGALVEANFNNDIVGTSRGGNGFDDAQSVRVYSEGPEDSPSRALARFVERVAGIYVPAHRIRLMARYDRFGRGSDHSSFNQYGYPAVVFRESLENFSGQHGPGDTIEKVNFSYLAQNARVNAAGVASLALAPPAPVVINERKQSLLGRGPSGYDANLKWSASSGAAGYRIYWRDSWINSWQRQQFVGNVIEFVLPGVSIDDFVFGVAAVGPQGHESLVSSYVSPFRPYPEIKLNDR